MEININKGNKSVKKVGEVSQKAFRLLGAGHKPSDIYWATGEMGSAEVNQDDQCICIHLNTMATDLITNNLACEVVEVKSIDFNLT